MTRSRTGQHGATATLKEVAEAANVSEMTVSRVMRKSACVSQKTREQVLEAASKLGYVPNRIAGALASRSSNLLGLVVPSMTNHVYPEVVAGVADVLEASPLQPVFGITDYDASREEQLIQDMLSWRPSGLAVCGFSQTAAARRLLASTRIPVVQMMETDGDPIEYNVGISHHEAGKVMAMHLSERGYRRIAYIGSNLEHDVAAHKRFTGFSQALKAHGLPLVKSLAPDEASSVGLGRALTQTMLASSKRVDAIHYSNDNMAVGGLMHCIAAGVSVPGKVALSGFAGLDIVDALPTRLTTIRSPRREIGRHTARYILGRLDGKARRSASRDELSFELRVGEST